MTEIDQYNDLLERARAILNVAKQYCADDGDHAMPNAIVMLTMASLALCKATGCRRHEYNDLVDMLWQIHVEEQ